MSKQTIAEMQADCEHGSWANGGQIGVPAVKSGKVVLINTLFCKKCGAMLYSIEELALPDSVTGSGIVPVTMGGKTRAIN